MNKILFHDRGRLETVDFADLQESLQDTLRTFSHGVSLGNRMLFGHDVLPNGTGVTITAGACVDNLGNIIQSGEDVVGAVLTQAPPDGTFPRQVIVGVSHKETPGEPEERWFLLADSDSVEPYQDNVITRLYADMEVRILAGTPASNPQNPTIPHDVVPLARVLVYPGMATITAEDIFFDVRPTLLQTIDRPEIEDMLLALRNHLEAVIETRASAIEGRSITAGNGLTGGGTLQNSRTLNLGTPSTITTSTTNSASGTTHTHALTLPATMPPSSHTHTADEVSGLPEGLLLGETSTTAYRGDRGKVAYDHSQATHAPTNAQANQTVTAGNGMSFTTTSGNVTITMGTPGSLSNTTTNATTATSHTHAISGFALSSHNHDASNINAGTIANARIAGTYDGITVKLSGVNTLFSLPNTGSHNTAGRTVSHLAEFRSSASAHVGVIAFIAPNTNSTIMYSMELVGMIYNAQQLHVRVQGYRTTGAWSALNKVNLGTMDPMVRWAVTPDGKNCLLLGDVGTSWSYPHISIVRAKFSQTNANDAHCSGWTVATVTDLAGYTQVTSALSNSAIVTNISGNATTATTLATARTINGVSFNGSANISINTNQSLTAGNGLSGSTFNGGTAQTWSLGTPTALSNTTTDAVTASSHTHSLPNRTSGSTSAGYVTYNGTTATAGTLDGGTTTPTGTTRLNYGGYFYATRLYEGTTQVALSTRNITAGNGLSGGGNLTADRTITLGTPGTITTATTNSVTATSHTHALTLPALLALGETSATAYRGDRGKVAYDHSQVAHAPSGAQANQTLTSGNGMATWTATSGNLTIALGTPSSITGTSTNSVTATSHTHALILPTDAPSKVATGSYTGNGSGTSSSYALAVSLGFTPRLVVVLKNTVTWSFSTGHGGTQWLAVTGRGSAVRISSGGFECAGAANDSSNTYNYVAIG